MKNERHRVSTWKASRSASAVFSALSMIFAFFTSASYSFFSVSLVFFSSANSSSTSKRRSRSWQTWNEDKTTLHSSYDYRNRASFRTLQYAEFESRCRLVKETTVKKYTYSLTVCRDRNTSSRGLSNLVYSTGWAFQFEPQRWACYVQLRTWKQRPPWGWEVK